MSKAMFRAHDIRAKRECFEEPTASVLALALARYWIDELKVDSVVVCRDTRLGGAALMQRLVDVFVEEGLKVFLEPNPVGSCHFYHICMTQSQSAGVMITASHNPGSYLGMKLVGPNLQPISMGYGPKGGIEQIRTLFGESHLASAKKDGGNVVLVDTLASFVEQSMALAGVEKEMLRGTHVAYDFLHGIGFPAIGLASQKAGVTYDLLHGVPDGNFPVGDPNPGIEKSMQGSMEYLKNTGTKLLLAYDGDGDRMDLIYKGKQLSPSMVMYCIVDQLVALNPEIKNPVILFDVKSSPPLISGMIRRGYTLQVVRNGHSAIKQIMNNGALCAVEESAHYYYQLPLLDQHGVRVPSENTLFYTLLILKAYSQNPSLFEEAQKLQDSFFREREWAVVIKDEQKRDMFLAELNQAMTDLGATRYEEGPDGSSLGAVLYRLNLPKNWETEELSSDSWFQVFQRLSESEDNVLRFEVLAAKKEEGVKIVELLHSLQSSYL